ncbi:MAG: phosphoenolpyruvate--protein phosphotransferase [Myxococcota bacterium]
MQILEELIQLAARDVAPSEMLRSAAQAIGTDLGADLCRIYLRRYKGPLMLRASFPEPVEFAGALEAERLASAAISEVSLVAVDDQDGHRLAIPLVSRSRSSGALVVERRSVEQPFLQSELDRVSAIASQLVDLVEGADFLEVLAQLDTPPPQSLTAAESAPGERIIEGAAASPGVAIGVAVFRHAFPSKLVKRHGGSGDERVERERLRNAFQKTQQDLLRMQSAAASELGEEHALIFGAHLLLLHDSMLLSIIELGLKNGRAVAVAVDDAFQEIGRRLRAVPDPYIQERLEDVEDLHSRVLGHLLEIQTTVVRHAHVVVSPRTSPSVIMELKAQGALGVASEFGGTTSHGVLLARALGVPAVTGVPDLLREVANGDALIIDGDQGRVILRPSAESLEDYQRRALARELERASAAAFRARPAQTADGLAFKLQANVALGVDLDVARENGASGVGLYRTEFAFIARDGLPSRDEQVRIYTRAYQAFPEGPISFRVLDLAGDKFLSFAGLGVERSPFHGYRSIRVLFDHPHILRTQAQAFALAAGQRPLRILIPMVSSIEELRRVKELVQQAISELPSAAAQQAPSFGAMIEIPAAVEIVADLAREVDFFSIGTNDLIQYTLVVDREDSRHASPRDVFHPAILRMIRRVVLAAHEAGREVSVCGEAAARAEFAIALLALGVDTLSVSPRSIPELKQRLSSVRIDPLVTNMDILLSSSETSEVEQKLRQALSGERS